MKNIKANIKDLCLKHILELLIIVFVVVMCFTVNGFASFRNIIGIVRSMSMIGVLAFGIMTVIICGEIDLSAVSTVAMTGIVAGLFCKAMPEAKGAALLLSVLVMSIFACIMGLVHTFLVLKFGVPAFIVTMASNYVVYGVAATLCKGFPVTGFPSWFNYLGSGTILGIIPVPTVILLLIFGITYFLLNYSKIGRAVYAVGGNKEAARLTGINVVKTKVFAFSYVQLMAVLAGMMLSSQVMSGTYSFGDGWDFQGISCVVIGDTPFTGGAGTVWGTLLGLFFYGMVNNAMTLLNVSQFVQYIIRGAVILLAIILNSYKKNK